MLPLERRGHGEAEGFSRFQQGVVEPRVESVVCYRCRVRRRSVLAGEHARRDLYRRRCAAIEAQGIVGVVNAEGRIDDGKHRLQFDSGGHTRNPVGAGNRAADPARMPAQFRFAHRSQAKPVVSVGQPNRVLIRVLYWVGLICNCEVRMIGSVPISTKGAMATGPAMVMRYSKLPFRLRSPPGSHELIVRNRDIPAVTRRTLPLAQV